MMAESTATTEARPKYYKILKDGRSNHGGQLTWSLPSRGAPGGWHEVDGVLRQCRNGLHLTSEPHYLRQPGTTCYLAEIDGETIGPYGTELVVRRCRLVRMVLWKDLIPEGDKEGEPKVVVSDSPALTLMRHVWKHEGHGMGQSWSRLNSVMQVSLRLAIQHGLRFGPDDFATFAKDFNSCRWIGDGERYYSEAICHDRRNFGPNSSAYQSFEKWLGRKPFILRQPDDASGSRMYVGRRFKWHDGKAAFDLTVTSFAKDQASLTACSYSDASRSKIARRFTVTHETVREFHKRLHDAHNPKVKPAKEVA